MKRIALPLLALAAGAVMAVASGAPLSPQEINALTPIDSVPTKPQLDLVFNGAPQARDRLVAIAQDPGADVGVRLRAIHTLWKYCPVNSSPTSPTPCDVADPAHVALLAMVPSVAASWPHSGADLLLLRAAIEALGLLKVATDSDLLAKLLDHPSRDIRTTAAHALRDLCNTGATPALRVRYSHENVDEVRLAISDALRALATCGPVN